MSDPTTRAITLLGLLESRPVWAGSELAGRLGVTTRTVRRDVERLRSLGYRVYADRGADGGYALARTQVLPPLLLDDEESVAVMLALELLGRSGEASQAEAARRAAGKIDAIMVAPARHRVQGLREAMSLTPVTGRMLGALEPCAEAIRRSLQARFTYVDRHGDSSRRRVEPHRLAARGRLWKLVAYDLDRDAWRTFRLERVTEWHTTTWRFRPRDDVDAAVARLDTPVPTSIWRHQITVDIDAPIEAVRERMPYLAGRLSALSDSRTRLRTGGDDAADVAAWVAQIPFDFVIESDEAVVEAVTALGQRLVRAGRRDVRG